MVMKDDGFTKHSSKPSVPLPSPQGPLSLPLPSTETAVHKEGVAQIAEQKMNHGWRPTVRPELRRELLPQVIASLLTLWRQQCVSSKRETGIVHTALGKFNSLEFIYQQAEAYILYEQKFQSEVMPMSHPCALLVSTGR